jgi:4-amino-4-deoxy-L-arabinose transferase-like glycosyltransferase
MGQLANHRLVHYLLLLGVGSLLFFPNLGAHTLWDIDESHNAECAREMLAVDDYVVPTFNGKLRTDKPILQYWFIIAAYKLFGVSEFAARFWSTVCGLSTMLLTYELGRRMFDAATGLLAGLVLASSLMFCVSSHAVTPDAFLILLVTASFLIFWRDYTNDSGNWLIFFGITTGLAVLAKGPVGLVLPAAVNTLFLFWERRWRILLSRRLLLGALVWGLVAGPWYGLVAGETKWEFWKGFFLKHNLERFNTPLEGHRGPFFYHPLVLLAAFAPWSCFLGLTAWLGTGRRARQDASGQSNALPSPYRFLWCWIAVWMVVFSVASTKLPNYLLPCYPALALLTARALVRWRAGAVAVSPYLVGACVAGIAAVGLVVGLGALVGSGQVEFASLSGRVIPELAPFAALGLLPLVVCGWVFYSWKRGARGRALSGLVCGMLVFVGLLAAFGPVVVDRHKVTRAFAEQIAANQSEREVRIACYKFYQPGLVFYADNTVSVLRTPQAAIDHLHIPLQAFLVVPVGEWESLAAGIEGPVQVIARKRDFVSGKEIVLVMNRPLGREQWTASTQHVSNER